MGEKEKAVKWALDSIENRVRSVYNSGYAAGFDAGRKAAVDEAEAEADAITFEEAIEELRGLISFEISEYGEKVEDSPTIEALYMAIEALEQKAAAFKKLTEGR